MKKLPPATIGVGDRFGLEGEARLKAAMEARARGLDAAPAGDKSFRERPIVGTGPGDVRASRGTVGEFAARNLLERHLAPLAG